MKLKLLSIAFLFFLFSSCGGENKKENQGSTSDESVQANEDPMLDKGVGPIKSLKLEEIDPAKAEEGLAIFNSKCTACHKIGKRYIGPDLTGVTEKQSPEWIMNMILNPEVMVVENQTAKNLLMEYSAPMANQNLTEQEARSVLEYFRTLKTE